MVHQSAKVIENCRISHGITIGNSANFPTAQILGNNIFIGPNEVIVGEITIADGVAVGANSYVDKSFVEPNVTIGGCPARKVSSNGSKVCRRRATEILAGHARSRKTGNTE